MTGPTVGVLHPGAMGAAVAAGLTSVGTQVLWLPSGRSEATRTRAERSGMTPVDDIEELAARCSLILSVCPPDAALDVATGLPDFAGTFVDANATSRATSDRIEGQVRSKGATYVDGSIIGPPPSEAGTTSLYLAGEEAAAVAAAFSGTVLGTVVLSDRPGDASAVKMAYAAWTKGSSALLLASRELARAEGVEDALLREWADSLPGLADRAERARQQATEKGWRWAGEMDQIADSFATAGLPDGFHRAAAEVYRQGIGASERAGGQ